jgi:hypothetical protein
MSYKFQRGAATLSGSITAEDGLDAGDSGVASAGAITGGTTANFSGVVTAGGLTVGNAVLIEAELETIDDVTAGTAAASKAVVLDVSKNIATIGTIGCGAITSTGASSFAGGITPAAADGAALGSAAAEWSDLYLADGGRINLGNDQDVYIEHVADEGIKLQSVNAAADKPTKLLLNFSSSTPADNDQVGLIQMDGYDDAGNVQTWAKIQAVSTDVTNADEDSKLSFSVATQGVVNAGLILESAGVNGRVDVTVGLGAASTVTIPGNLTVNGTTTTIDTTNLTVKDANIVLAQGSAGNADDIGFTFGTLSNVQTLQTVDSDGTQKLGSSLPLSASFFYGDGANLTGITADTANTAGGYSYNKYDATTSAAHNPNGVSGFIVASGSDINNPLSASAITSIHLSGAWEDGMVLHIKAPSNASSFNLNINASGSDKIDGEDSIVLESDYAAVTLLRCHSTRWSIV